MAKTLVHVTHEVVGKIGGIGAVLRGLLTSNSYLNAIERSIIVGPLFHTEGSLKDRLGEDVEVLYSSLDGFADTEYAQAFGEIENFFNASIVYGRREFIDNHTGIKSSPEVLLIDVRYMNKGPVDKLKRQFFEEFGIRSDLYEHIWEYEEYVRLAPAAIDALKAIGAAEDSTTIIAHEFMGMPTALASILEPSCCFKTAFYAHEVATIRQIVENHPGHDIMFYNVIKQAQEKNIYLDQIFGDQSSYFKHPLVEASKYCDTILAVGDYVADELKFLAPEFKTANINVVYNGISAHQISVEEKLKSKDKLQQYCKNLLDYKPDFVFTHITRLVQSKGLWRDLRILEHIEKAFRERGQTAVMLLLSTQVSQRDANDILNMETSYNWPVAHREGWPDLSAGEAEFYTSIQRFNAISQNIKVVFINQFGFSQQNCGSKMSNDMDFMDIRKGSDVEFGLSIYEPFGISHIETLPFGGICVISSVCGCLGFAKRMCNLNGIKNIIVADYTNQNDDTLNEIDALLEINKTLYNQLEDVVNDKVANEIIQRLTRDLTKIEEMIQTGYDLAKNISWDTIAKNYLLKNLQNNISPRQHEKQIYTESHKL